MRKKLIIIILLATAKIGFTQPDPNNIQIIDGVSVWKDLRDASKFYYAPGKLELASGNNGKPLVKLMLIRYTGNTINNDEGQHRMRSILQFRIKQNNHSKTLLNHIRQQLRAFTLNPLPVFKTTFLVALPSLKNTDTAVATNGFLEKNDNEKKDAYWEERDFTLRLDDLTAQYIKAQLESSRLLMYCSYTFYAQTAIMPDPGNLAGNQTPNVPLKAVAGQSSGTGQQRIIPIASNAFGIDVNTKKWNDIISDIDINSALPPSYPCLDIRCYDFENALSDTLYEKIIQIRATGVAGDDVNYVFRFNRKNPDVSVTTVRFKYAVRLDLPFSYKVSAINNDGEQFDDQWITTNNWSNMINITADNYK